MSDYGSHYARTIGQDTGAGPAMCNLIEEVMRTDRAALDALTPAEFALAAADAVVAIAEMHADGFLPRYCEIMRLPMPAIPAA